VFVFGEKSGKFTSITGSKSSLEGVQIHDFTRISSGEVLVASVDGAYVLPENDQIHSGAALKDDGEHLEVNPIFEGSDVLSLFSDANQLLWLGTESEGIVTVDRTIPNFEKLQFAGENNSNANRVYSMAQHSDTTVWAGTANGLKLISLTDSRMLNLADLGYDALGSLEVKVRSILNLDSLIWLGTDGNGLVKYDRVKDSLTYYIVSATKEQSISSNQVNEVIFGVDNSLWISTQGGGICHFDITSEIFSVYRFDGANRNSIRDNNVFPLILDSVGDLWAGTGNAGIYKLDVSENVLQSSTELGRNTLTASNI